MLTTRRLVQHAITPAIIGVGLVAGLVVLVEPRLFILAIVGIPVVAAGVRWPQLIVGMVFVAVLLDGIGGSNVEVSGLPVTASKVAVVLALGLWTVRVALKREAFLRWHPVVGAMILVVMAMSTSMAYAAEFQRAKADIYGMAMLAVLVCLVYTILRGRNLDLLYRFMAIAVILTITQTVLFSGGGRAGGTHGDANEWAAIVLMVTSTLVGDLAEDDHWMAKWLRLGVLGVAPISIIQSESRAGFVVLCLTVPVWLYLLRKRQGELGIAAAGAFVGMLLFADVSGAFERYATLAGFSDGSAAEDVSLSERSELLQQGLDLFKDHWFIGVGPGGFRTSTGYYTLEGATKVAHNTYVQVASENGVVGLAAFAVWVAAVLSTFARGVQSSGGRKRARLIGMTAGLAALGLMAGTLWLLTLSIAYVIIAVGLAVADTSEADDAPHP